MLERRGASATKIGMFPAEWATHKNTWLAWPDLPNEWKEDQPGAREEFLAFCRAILTEGSRPQEGLQIFVKSENEKAYLTSTLKDSAELHLFDYGDIWLRDTGCVFGMVGEKKVAHVFHFNGWGENNIFPRNQDRQEYDSCDKCPAFFRRR